MFRKQGELYYQELLANELDNKRKYLDIEYQAELKKHLDSLKYKYDKYRNIVKQSDLKINESVIIDLNNIGIIDTDIIKFIENYHNVIVVDQPILRQFNDGWGIKDVRGIKVIRNIQI
jgi:hypothetical protein